eukprot:gene4082-5828_t
MDPSVTTTSVPQSINFHLTNNQIEALQTQIRQFKSLGKRFSDLNIPKPDVTVKETVAVVANSVVKQDRDWKLSTGIIYNGQTRVYDSVAVSTNKLIQEGALPVNTSEIGCFIKPTHKELVLTRPFLSSIREQTFQHIVHDNKIVDPSENVNDEAWVLQRKIRSNLIEAHSSDNSNSFLPIDFVSAVVDGNTNPPISSLNYFNSKLLPFRNFIRTKKLSRRDFKLWEKEDRRRRAESEYEKKRRNSDFFRAILNHREEFFRFFRSKRTECTKAARLAKLWMENVDSKKEKDEARAEMRRLQALKENNMEAYMSLVQETKNGRLKFLLNETDNYIASINKMILDQRMDSANSSDTLTDSSTSKIGTREDNNRSGDVISSENKGGTQITKDYYRSTHNLTENVVQPRMLKGGDLKEYQLGGLQWLVSLYNNNLNGKTIQTISLLCYLIEFKNNNGPFLIIVPLSTLSNWVNEFNRWSPDIIKIVYKGQPNERKNILKDEVEPGNFNVLLTTYEYIMKDKTQLKKIPWQYIIVDEGHRMKNAQSKFAQTLGTQYQSKNRILLTGTPLQNNLPELWALLNFLLPTIFSSVDTFDQWFNKPFAAFRNQSSDPDGNAEGSSVLSQEERMLIVYRLHEVLRPFMLRRVKDQVLDQLPDKIEKVLKCNLAGWQRKMYHSIASKGLASKDKDNATTGGLNNTIMQLRKVCNHPYLFVRDYQIDEDLIRISGKFELLDRMLPKLQAAGHRVLIFSQMVELMNFLEQFFYLRGFTFLRLDGNTTSEEREKRMYAFNDPDSPYFVFLLSTRAGGLGLNLATADTVIIFDSDWNPMMDSQAQDRAHRIGQKNEVRVFRLLTNSPIEERIFARATDKRNLNGLVVEAGNFNREQTSEEIRDDGESKEMMETLLKEWSAGGTAGGYGDSTTIDMGEDGERSGDIANDDSEVPTDELINEMMASYPGEFELYQKMDSDRNKYYNDRWEAMHNHNHSRRGNSHHIIPPLPPRLMTATEMPIWLNESCWPSKYASIMNDMMGSKRFDKSPNGSDDEDTMIGGKIMRKRKSVMYDDGLTESQFIRFVEKEETTAILTSSIKESLPDSSNAVRNNNNFDNNNNNNNRRKSKGGSKDEPLENVYKDLLKIMKEILKIERLDGSLLAELFLEKPSKALYPDYYSIVPRPISLKEITNKIKNSEYDNIEEIELDFALMSSNARLYNLDISPIFSDCEMIRLEFHQRCEAIREKYDMNPGDDFIPLPTIGYDIYGNNSMSKTSLRNLQETSLTNNTNNKQRNKSVSAKKKSKAIEINDNNDDDNDLPSIKRSRPSLTTSSKNNNNNNKNNNGNNYYDNNSQNSISVEDKPLSISIRKPFPSMSSMSSVNENNSEKLVLSFSNKNGNKIRKK